jgi:hypothetical protein
LTLSTCAAASSIRVRVWADFESPALDSVGETVADAPFVDRFAMS